MMEDNGPDLRAPGARCRLAYLVNQYPKVSHTFIRREILALEALGHAVERFAIRGWDAEVTESVDAAEQGRTQYLLRASPLQMFAALVRQVWFGPGRTWAGLLAAVRMSRGGDRPLFVHVAYWIEACVLLQSLRRLGVEHLHAHFGTNSSEVAMLAHLMDGIPYSFTVHGPEEFDKPQSLHLLEKIQHAAFVVAVSSFGRSQLWRWTPNAYWNKVVVVHCGVGEDYLSSRPSPVPDTAQLVCVGRLCEQKGQLLLVRAIGKLRRDGVSVRLVLAGDGEMRGAIESAIRDEDVAELVEITGWVGSARIRELLESSRAMVLPSFAEGLPVVIMEAMAVGRPVLSTYVAGIPELVRHGREGWLFEAGSVDALATALRECLDADPEQLSAMGSSGRSRVAERHRAAHEAGKLAAHFERARKAGA